MSDDSRSITPANRACGRFLCIPNPGSDNSSDEDKDRIQPPSTSYPQSYVYQSPALPHSPPPKALQPRAHPNTHSLLDLTTNFKQYHPHPNPPSSQSTSNLSSASSSSSRAIDTTPPRSPGVPGRSPYIGFDASSGQGPYTGGSNTSKRDERGRVSARPSTFLGKIKARIPHRQPRLSRTSANHNQDLSQKFSTSDSYMPPAGPALDQIWILITTDADHYFTVDVVGSRSGAAIREHIFAKLQVSDEDQKHYSIYRTEVGAYALGESLQDDVLYRICAEQGDANGSLRFFVLHTSALVHEAPPPFSSLSPTAGSIIPPPVLPFHTGSFPVRPQRRTTGLNHGSVPSAGKQLHRSTGIGYEVSVFDDLENADHDAQWFTMRPHPANVPALRHHGGSSNRPGSPLHTLRHSVSNRELSSGTATQIESRANLIPPNLGFPELNLIPPSPTVSMPDSYLPIAGPILAQIRILITTDADQYLLVDVVGSSNGAAIRERIFTKLHVSDEDQKHYAIYRNQVGSGALGESLPDDALYNFCSAQGDANGSLRFFVSWHTSAPMHEVPSPSSSFSFTVGSTTPPPILPFHTGGYPMRPQRQATGSRHSGMPLVGKQLHREAGADYEASSSDNFEHADHDVQHSATRLHPAKVAALRSLAVWPDWGRRHGSSNRSRSLSYTLRPSGSNRELKSEANITPTKSLENLVPPIHGRHRITPSATKSQLPQEATGSKSARSLLDPHSFTRPAIPFSPRTAGPVTLLTGARRPSRPHGGGKHVPYNMIVIRKPDLSHGKAKTPPSTGVPYSGARVYAKSTNDLRFSQRSNPGPQPTMAEGSRGSPVSNLTSKVHTDGSHELSATHAPTTGESDERNAGLRPLFKRVLPAQSMRRPAPQHSLSTTPNYANALHMAIDPYSGHLSATEKYNRFGNEVDDEDSIYTPQAPRRPRSAGSQLDYGQEVPPSILHSFHQNPGINPSASGTRSPELSRTSSFSAGLTASPPSVVIQSPIPSGSPPSSFSVGSAASPYSAVIQKLSNFDTDISPRGSPREWNIAYDSHIRSAVLQGHGKLAGIREAYLGSYMVYPGLIIYIFIQLMECKAEAQKDFGDTLTKWRTWDDITAIEKHQQVKDYLMEMFVELKRLNSALHTRETFETLLVLDVLNISAQLTMLVMNDDCYKRLIMRHEEAAQALVNILQARLDYPIEPPFKSRHRKALVKLSELSQRYSECLLLEDITIPKDPVQCGSFGEVFKGDMAGCAIAVKVLKVYQKSNIDKILKSFSHEAVIWRQLSHPNVLPFYGVFADSPKLCLVSPWMKNGNLSDFLADIAPEIDCVPLALDVAKGLEYLHSQNVLHADLKCGNVLVSDARRACLADFGLSVVQDTNSILITGTSTIGIGTLAWTAPELLLDDTKRPDEACDVYSFSMVCYEIFSGCIPFQGKSGPQVIIAMSQGRRPERPVDPRSHRRGLTDDIWDIIVACWNQQPEARFTVGQAVQRLSTLPNRPPDNRPVDDDPPLSRLMYRQAHRPFSVLKMIPERESTGTPPVRPGSISQIFGLPDLWDSEG